MPDTKNNCNYAFVDFVSSSSVLSLLRQSPKIWIDNNLLDVKPSRSKKGRPSEKWRRSFVEDDQQLNVGSFAYDKEEIGLLSVWIENLNLFIKSREVYPILKGIGLF